MSRNDKHTGATRSDNLDEMTGRSSRAIALRQLDSAKRRDAAKKKPVKVGNKIYYIDKKIANSQKKLAEYISEKLSMEERGRNNHN